MTDKTCTTNGAIALATSGNIFVDFFMMFVRGICTETIDIYMSRCWNLDPKKTVAIIFHARDRERGKKEKNISNRAMIWLRKHKHNTYQKNLINYVANYGCWKDISYIALKMPRDHQFEVSCFAKQLQQDKENYNAKKYKDISLCAKWASSEKDKYDVKINLAHDIASELFPNDMKNMEKYRKELIVPLREHIKIVETTMSHNMWNDIKYDNVPAVAMKRLRNAFMKHDKEGYEAFLAQIKNGERKMKVTGILPHELVKHYINNGEYDETIELQWKALVENIKQQDILSDIIAIVDVSGSMFSGGNSNVQPIDVSVALGLLISECATGPWKNKVISFHKTPAICEIKGNNLYERVKNIRYIPAGLNTNFDAVFDLIINAGKMFNIPSEKMPEKCIILSDMQFDEASSNTSIDMNENTIHEHIVKKYKETIYVPPKFIYWNLSSQYNETFPVKAMSDNVAMISGFSEQLLKVFMNANDFNPESIINDILSKYILEVDIDENDIL